MIVTQDTMGQLDWEKSTGLIPAIAQDEFSGQVLMMAWMNKASLQKTLTGKKATFFSRSRNKLWKKGEDSGNELIVSQITCDCDKDTLLLQVKAKGPACHLGTTSCWPNTRDSSLTFLAKLDTLLEERKSCAPESSYTAHLYNSPINRIAQKVGEEAVETVLASVAGDNNELLNESADLLYHLMVLLRAKGLSIRDTIELLNKRHH